MVSSSGLIYGVVGGLGGESLSRLQLELKCLFGRRRVVGSVVARRVG